MLTGERADLAQLDQTRHGRPPALRVDLPHPSLPEGTVAVVIVDIFPGPPGPAPGLPNPWFYNGPDRTRLRAELGERMAGRPVDLAVLRAQFAQVLRTQLPPYQQRRGWSMAAAPPPWPKGLAGARRPA